MYVFNARKGFPSAVFDDKALADEWIRKHGLTGVLTGYPLNTGSYEYAVENGFFKPRTDEHRSSSFIGLFSNAMNEHYHYEEGEQLYRD